MPNDLSLIVSVLPGDVDTSVAEVAPRSIERMTPSERMEVLGVPGAVLDALQAMARLSSRYQADSLIALHRAGLVLSQDQQKVALAHLCEDGWVRDVIPLDDGGLLVSVTSAGMQRAYEQLAA